MKKFSTKDITVAALFTALIAVGAFVSIPIGVVPITLQTLFLMLAAFTLGKVRATLASLVYVVIGLVGIPVFAGGNGGPSHVFSPTFGYLIAFVIGAYIAAAMVERGLCNSTQTQSCSCPLRAHKSELFVYLKAGLVYTVIIYVIGLAYLYMILNIYLHKNVPLEVVFKTGCFVFLPGDIIKMLVAMFISIKLRPLLATKK